MGRRLDTFDRFGLIRNMRTCPECGAELTFKSYWMFKVPPPNTVKCFGCKAAFPVTARHYYLSILVGVAISIPLSGVLFQRVLELADRLHSAPMRGAVEAIGMGAFLLSYFVFTTAVMVLMLSRHLKR